MTTKMVYNRNFLVKLLSILKKVKATPYKDLGICQNVANRLLVDCFQAPRLLRSIFKLWP